MYLRQSTQKRADGSKLRHLQIAENEWDPVNKRSRVRILYNCGRADDPKATERLRRLARSILKRCSPEELVAADTGPGVVDAWPHGEPHALQALWRRVGLPELIDECVAGRKFGFRVERALFALVAHRVCAPSSKLRCHSRWLAEAVRIEGCGELELQHLYRAMDMLEAHKDALEEGLYHRLADLPDLDVEVMFYDTAPLHFEVADGEQHRKRVCELRASGRFGRYLRLTRGGRPRVDRAKVKAAERLDGKFVVHGNDDTLTGEDLALGYKQLYRVEQSWRQLKSELRLRPVHHRVARRIHAHIAPSVIALLLERMAEHARGDTWRNIRDDLRQIKLVQLSGPNGDLRQVTEPRPNARKRLKSLQIKTPPPILKLG